MGYYDEGWSDACGCERVRGVHDPADHPHDLPVREIKNVSLVTYREGGERVEIGSAEVRPDGTVTARVEGPNAAGLLDGALDGFSFGLGASMPDRDAGMLDALASVRAENRRLRRDLADVTARLQEQLEEARAMRADVAELARQAGVLLGEQVAKP